MRSRATNTTTATLTPVPIWYFESNFRQKNILYQNVGLYLQGSQWQSSPYRYHYSPGAHVGSVSSGVESHYSDESDEDNNCGADIDAIAQVVQTVHFLP